ncbi:MAG: DUF4384 domain-containing protein [Bryobacteraceae bacterium]
MALVLALPVATGMSQTKSAPQTEQRMEITVERLEHGAWKLVDPGLVFARNDRVRFRYRANFAGYLYVTNRSTSGKYEQLFPREETGQDNRIAPGKEYTVPATDTVFRIAGPAGHELIYWLASPVALTKDATQLGTGPSALPPLSKPRPDDLIPRCDDAIFRARGECVDSSAGTQGITEGQDLPEALAGARAATPRDLLFLRKEKTTVVASPVPLTGPIVYEFRLAHQ